MVDTRKRTDRETLLSRRVERLTEELDQLENAHAKYWNIIRKSITALSSLAHTEPGSQVELAVKDLRNSTAQRRGSLKSMTAKVDALQSALINAPAAKTKMTGKTAVEVKERSSGIDEAQKAAFLSAVSALSALAPNDPESGLKRSVDRLKTLLDEKSIRPEAVKEASQAVKNQLLAHEVASRSPRAVDLKKELQPHETKALLGWRLAARLLAGMHLEDDEFDQSVAKVEMAVEDFLDTGEVDKPTLAMAADLMENLKSILERRHQDAQNALFEIVRELMATEAELMRTVDQNGQNIISTGDLIQSEMGNRLATLVKDVSQAKDLDTMKGQILGHVQSMRQNLAQRISSQRALTNATMERVSQLKQVVNEAHNRIKLAEEKSRRWGREALDRHPHRGVEQKSFGYDAYARDGISR